MDKLVVTALRWTHLTRKAAWQIVNAAPEGVSVLARNEGGDALNLEESLTGYPAVGGCAVRTLLAPTEYPTAPSGGSGMVAVVESQGLGAFRDLDRWRADGWRVLVLVAEGTVCFW